MRAAGRTPEALGEDGGDRPDGVGGEGATAELEDVDGVFRPVDDDRGALRGELLDLGVVFAAADAEDVLAHGDLFS